MHAPYSYSDLHRRRRANNSDSRSYRGRNRTLSVITLHYNYYTVLVF